MTELKTFSELALKIAIEQRAETERTRLERIDRKRDRQDQSVVGGVYRPDPVDRAAAMLLARAPWWAFAPSMKQQPEQEDSKMEQRSDQELKAMGTAVKEFSSQFGATVEEIMAATDDSGNCVIAENMIRILLRYVESKTPQKARETVQAMLGVKDVVASGTVSLMQSINDLDRTMTDAVQKVRSSRMCIVSDASSAVNALRDIRQFFLGPDYEREQKRLAEFVDLCERLKRLKDSGFLDTVADTMIRLAAYEK
jgi:hypothetical protein